MIRLFTALEIPDEVLDCLTALQSGLPGARWVARENLHLTLRFIGSVDEAMAADVDHALARIETKPFPVCVEGLGSFGDKKNVRSVWAGVAANDALANLNRKIEQGLQSLGLDANKRKFTPHVTLARLRNGSNREVAHWIEGKGGLTCPSFTATRLVLFSSQTRAEGAIYTPERYYVF